MGLQNDLLNDFTHVVVSYSISLMHYRSHKFFLLKTQRNLLSFNKNSQRIKKIVVIWINIDDEIYP